MINHILAIDPGNMHSAFCYVSTEDFRPIRFGKVENSELKRLIHLDDSRCAAAIEMVASYGMPVGREVFETCVWIGRFAAELESFSRPVRFVYRKDVKLELCAMPTAGDANIRRALIDRFAEHDLRTGKGTKKNPDWFYGFHDDIWAAYAVAVTYIDQARRNCGG